MVQVQDVDIVGLYRKYVTDFDSSSADRKQSRGRPTSEPRGRSARRTLAHYGTREDVAERDERIEYLLMDRNMVEGGFDSTTGNLNIHHQFEKNGQHRSRSADVTRQVSCHMTTPSLGMSAARKLHALRSANEELYYNQWMQHVGNRPNRAEYFHAPEEPCERASTSLRNNTLKPLNYDLLSTKEARLEQRELLRRMTYLQREEKILEKKSKAHLHNIRCANVRARTKAQAELQQALVDAAQLQIQRVDFERKAMLEEQRAERLRCRAMERNRKIQLRKNKQQRSIQQEKKLARAHHESLKGVDALAEKLEKAMKQSIETQWKEEVKDRQVEYAKEARENTSVARIHRIENMQSLLKTQKNVEERIRRARFCSDLPLNTIGRDNQTEGVPKWCVTGPPTQTPTNTTIHNKQGHLDSMECSKRIGTDKQLRKPSEYHSREAWLRRCVEEPAREDVDHFGKRIHDLMDKMQSISFPLPYGNSESSSMSLMYRTPLRWK